MQLLRDIQGLWKPKTDWICVFVTLLADNERAAGKRTKRRETKRPVAGNTATLRRKTHERICKLQPRDGWRGRLSTVDDNPAIARWNVGRDGRVVDCTAPAHESAQQQPTRSAPSVTATRTHAPHAQHKRPVHTPHTPTRARTLPPTLTGWSPSTGDTQPSHQHTKARSSPHGQSAPSSLQHAQTPRKHSTNDPYTHHTHQQEHGHCRRHSLPGAQAPETHSQATSTRKRAAAAHTVSSLRDCNTHTRPARTAHTTRTHTTHTNKRTDTAADTHPLEPKHRRHTAKPPAHDHVLGTFSIPFFFAFYETAIGAHSKSHTSGHRSARCTRQCSKSVARHTSYQSQLELPTRGNSRLVYL